MKKNVLFAVLIFSVSVVYSQSLKEVQKEVRQIYAQAMQQMKLQQSTPEMAKITTVKSTSMVGGVGLCETTIEFFAQDAPAVLESQSNGTMPQQPYFVRERMERKQSDIGNELYEYLYHPETGEMCFFLHKNSNLWAEEPVFVETRYYYTSDGTFVGGTVQVRSKETGKILPFVELEANPNEAAEAQRTAKRYDLALDHLVNHKQ